MNLHLSHFGSEGQPWEGTPWLYQEGLARRLNCQLAEFSRVTGRELRGLDPGLGVEAGGRDLRLEIRGREERRSREEGKTMALHGTKERSAREGRKGGKRGKVKGAADPDGQNNVKSCTAARAVASPDSTSPTTVRR